MPAPDISRKVRQLDNDVQAIYEMLAKIEATQTRHGTRLAELAESVDELAESLAAVDGKLGGLGDTVGQVDGKLDRIMAILEQQR